MELNKQVLFGASEKQQVKFFKFYAKLPMILAIAIASLFFISGIISMLITGAFLVLLILLIIGVALSIITYALVRVSYSYKLLHIIYLQKLLGEKVAKENRIDIQE